MEVFFQTTPFPLLVIHNFLDDTELLNLSTEVRGLWDANLLSQDTPSAVSNNNKLRTGTSVWVRDIYKDPTKSQAIIAATKLLTSFEIWNSARMGGDWFLADTVADANDFHVLINCYGNNEGYESHRDNSRVTAILTLKDADQEVSGGEFEFPEHGLTYPLQQNTILVFPSVIKHRAAPIKIKQTTTTPGRYSVAIFIDRR